jgi:hypothetical protein
MPDEPLGRLAPVHGRKGEVAVTITGMSYRAKNGEHRFAYADFPPDLLHALYDQLVAPRLKGILGRKMLCPACDVRVDNVIPARRTISMELTFNQVPPVGVELLLPTIECPSCRRVLVDLDDRQLTGDLGDALIDAFNAGGLRR